MAERSDKEEENGDKDKHPVDRVSGILDGIGNIDQYIEDIQRGRPSTGNSIQASAALETIQALGGEIATGGRKFTRDEMNER